MEMPMYGIQKRQRAVIEKKLYPLFEDDETKNTNMDQTLNQTCIQALWKLPHREGKYLAIDMAMHYKECIGLETFDLYEDMIREDYMWWDLLDPIAINLVGGVAHKHWNEDMKHRLRRWIQDDNLWIRRTALLAQLKFQQDVDHKLLFDFCRQRMHEKEFFIRKAVGWVLRDYSRFNPDAVIDFLTQEKANLNVLSYREGSKRLVKQARM
jgi:3-methyladenine DNA glycosylase AlkD